MKITRVGLDIAKVVFQVHGVNEHGAVKARKTLARAKVLEYFVQLPPCLIGNRGVRHRAPLGTRAHQAWAYGEADGAAVRGGLPQAGQERRQ